MITKTDDSKVVRTIDAAGKKLGRIASEAAKVLMGKTTVAYVPHKDAGASVVIVNASRLHMPEKKRRDKKYQNYSGYPGGLREISLSQLVARKGYGEALRRAIKGMLPRNTMLTGRLKRLKITE